MNAFTNTKPLVDTSVYRKSEAARKGGTLRAIAEGGAALKLIGTGKKHERVTKNIPAVSSVR